MATIVNTKTGYNTYGVPDTSKTISSLIANKNNTAKKTSSLPSTGVNLQTGYNTYGTPSASKLATSKSSLPSTGVNLATGYNTYGTPTTNPATSVAAQKAAGTYSSPSYSDGGYVVVTGGSNGNTSERNYNDYDSYQSALADTLASQQQNYNNLIAQLQAQREQERQQAEAAAAARIKMLQEQQEAERRRAEEAARAQREAAQNAYNRGMDYLNNAYTNRTNLLSSNLDSTKQQLLDKYNSSTKNVNADAAESLRQAYVNRMLSQKNLAQQMSAQGLSGGASETTMANLLNNYGNARNNIENTKANNLANLSSTYNDNYANAVQSYNNALADSQSEKMRYAMDLENALANNQISTERSYQDALSGNNSAYLNALSDAISNIAQYTYNPTSASNDVNLASVIQAISNGGTTPTSNRRSGGSGSDGVLTMEDIQNQANQDYLVDLLRSIYG